MRLRYFTGQLSREAIDGVAHLEIHTQENAGHDPDFADMLQCELVSCAVCCSNAAQTARGRCHQLL